MAPKNPWSFSLPFLVILVAAAALSMTCLFLFGSQDQKPYIESAPAVPGHSEVRAWSICKQFVEDKLRAPQSAEFANWSETEVLYYGDSVYRVVSYVDHRNTYNAPVRTRFGCSVRYQGNKRWRLVSLDLN